MYKVSKSKLAAINTIFSFVQQLVSIISGFIIPRLLLVNYGSVYNGLISSICQILSCIILLNGGVGGVTRAALYKALKNNDSKEISSIIKATESYLHKIGFVFIIIVFLLALIYPIRVKNEFSSYSFVFTLILILSITNFCQYFFGLAFQTLLVADQKQYIKAIIQIISDVLSTVLSAILIISKVDIRIVKLVAAICFSLSAVFIRFFTIKKYNLDFSVKPNNLAIKQRWDAFAHTLANFVHSNTDIVILTVFTNTLEISVYTIYYLVLNGMKRFFDPINTIIESLFGNTMNQDSEKQFHHTFFVVERLIIICTSFIFTMCISLIVPFVMIYTSGVEDVDYYRTTFAILACTAEFVYCLRIPYQSVVQASGHFKQTRNGAIFEALINIIISIILVNFIGIVGVAIGTLIAMTIRTIQYAFYSYKVLLNISVRRFVIQILPVFILYCIVYYVNRIVFSCLVINTWFKWFIYAISLSFIVGILIVMVSYFFDKENTTILIKMIRKKLNKRSINVNN